MKKDLTRILKCLLCNSKKLNVFLNLGKIPITNILLKKKSTVGIPTLKILVCRKCWHAQVEMYPNAKKVYVDKYSYHTKFNRSMSGHFRKYIADVKKATLLKKNDLIIDIGGNDGVLLDNFKKKKFTNLLNIEPNINAVKNSRYIGVKAENLFFNKETSEFIKNKYGMSKIIFSTNTFGNIDNLNNFVDGIYNIMDDKSVFIFENPYLLRTLEQVQFDTMYYEHVSYFSVSPLVKFFNSKNMELFKCIETKIHGGSMMYFVKKNSSKKITSNIKKFLKKEKKSKLNKIETYKAFAAKVMDKKNKIQTLLKSIKKNKKKIIAYGASDRGTVFMNYCKISNNEVAYVVDKNTKKIGYLTPGNYLKIKSIKNLYMDRPEYVLLNAWNFKDEILKQFKQNMLKTKVIIPFPIIKIVNCN